MPKNLASMGYPCRASASGFHVCRRSSGLDGKVVDDEVDDRNVSWRGSSFANVVDEVRDQLVFVREAVAAGREGL